MTRKESAAAPSPAAPGPAAPAHVIRARRVRFDWSDTPLHWVPGDPFTTHVINVLHLLLPAGEKWFCDVYRQALPMVGEEGADARIAEDAKGFIGQESVHARAHAAVLDHLSSQGLPTQAYTQYIDWMFNKLLGDRPRLPRFLQRQWLVSRLAIVAAIEHITCILGWWILTGSEPLEAARADPIMLDLLRWHGAEEVEHRSVAFDLFQHVSGSYIRRLLAWMVTIPVILGLWWWGARFLLRRDPKHPLASGTKATMRQYWRTARTGRLPAPSYLVRSSLRYLRPGHHPSREGSTELALAYLAISPAATSAGR